ncbi:hypothetical protein [Pseudomonas lini]|uniref:hypothetical protein n=1 Tax=Pseudomonas lini TaxID=163011 RepID=UPI00345E7CA6
MLAKNGHAVNQTNRVIVFRQQAWLLQNEAQKKTPDQSRRPIGGFEAKPYKKV